MQNFSITTNENGQNVVVELEGFTGHPRFAQYRPGYMKPVTGWVDDCTTTHILYEDEGGVRRSVRVNFWGKLAKVYKQKIVDNKQVARIRIYNARISGPFKDRNGTDRFSININSTDQFEVVSKETHQATQQEELHKAFDPQNKITNNLI